MNFPVVGVGASAGGLEAFTSLLKALPANTGMAFVLIQHLAPSYTSLLSELLSRATPMPVSEISDGLALESDHVYVIPPNANVGILHGVLHLLPRETMRGHYLPVDYFLRALAQDVGNKAIGIILSGTASDGVLGLKEIKAAGGITFAQDEKSAEYNGMPHSAIAAGVVDFVMSPAKIAAELAQLHQHPYLSGRREPATKEGEPIEGEPIEGEPIEGGESLSKLFFMLRQQTGNDFTYYKPSTIQRRIRRRMVLHKLHRLQDYVRFMQRTPAEVDALFHDILIHVTSFFRDPEVFDELKKLVYPALMKDRTPGVPLRIWVPGCSSGEEVYSLVISLLEFLGEKMSYTPIQIFGTDLDDQAIDVARQGVFPESIAQSVSPERLHLFFTKVEQGYQINRQVRDRCVFSRHNVFRDPPFSRMDLISCRNLLIYLGPVLQKKALQVLHYALNPKGYLLLGAAETIGRYADLFSLVDKKQKIYSKKSLPLSREVVPTHLAMTPPAPGDINSVPKGLSPTWTNLDLQREVDRMLLRKFAPPGVVVDEELNIVQFRGQTGAYLEPTPGEASLKLVKMARNGLAMELTSLIQDALDSNRSVRRSAARLYSATGSKFVTLEVSPIHAPPTAGRFLLITFEEAVEPAAVPAEELLPSTGTETAEQLQLRQELAASKEYLQSIIEEQEATNEELTSANEEIQASNEELQSINEELETAKEELQSTNEELATVNTELEERNDELEQINNDMGNLLGGLATAIVMVDKTLCLRRFTAEAEMQLKLNATDKGQPIALVRMAVDIPDLEQRLRQVIDTMAMEELELQNQEGHWFRLRMRPYKTTDDKIDGAVLAFLDIDELKRSLLAAEEARDYAQAIVIALRYPLLILDRNLQVITASDRFYQDFRVTPEETIGNLLYHLGNGQWGIPQLRELLEVTVREGREFEDYVVEHDFANIGHKVMSISGRLIPKGEHKAPLVLMQIEDITDRDQDESQR